MRVPRFSCGPPTVGITLVPPQAGPPLNKCIHPYVEIDGKPHDDIKYTVYFKDLDD